MAIALVVVVVGLGARIPAHLAGNLSEVYILRSIIIPESDLASYIRTEHVMGIALGLDPGLPRLPNLRRWFAEFQGRAVTAEHNRAVRGQLEAVVRSLALSEALSAEEEQQLWSLAYQKDDIEAWLVLAAIYAQSPDNAVQKQILDRLAARAPDQMISNNFIFGPWRLEGYDWLPLSTGPAQEARIVLYWRASTQLPTNFNPQTGTYQWGDRFVQVIVSRNLIANGDMEQVDFEGLVPIPQPWKLHPHTGHQKSSIARLVLDDRLTGNSVLHLINRLDETLLVTFPSLKTGSYYLILGQARISGEGVYMIMENTQGVNQFPIIIQLLDDNTWRSYGGVFTTTASLYPPGVYMGVKGDSSAVAEYDNLGVFAFALPPTPTR